MRDSYRNDFRSDRRPQSSQRLPRTPLDMKFLSSGYYSDAEKRKLREDLFKTEAERMGRTLADKKLTSTQLRRFFNEVRSIDAQIEGKFEEKKSLILMLKSKVAYSVGKDTSKTPKEFKEFIDACVEKINDDKDFDGFVKFFESVIGYYYYHSKIKEGN